MSDFNFRAPNTISVMLLCLAQENLSRKVRPEDLNGLRAGTSLSLLNILCNFLACLLHVDFIHALHMD